MGAGGGAPPAPELRAYTRRGAPRLPFLLPGPGLAQQQPVRPIPRHPAGRMAQQKERCIRSVIELEGFVKTTGDNLVLVYYSSPKCGLCKTTDGFLANMCSQHPELVLCKVNTEEAKEFIDAYGITGLPAFQYYRCGKKLYEFAGASTEHIYKIVCELNGY